MPRANTTSLRKEFEAYQAKFRRLCERGKVSQKCEVLFDGLRMLMRRMLTVFREKTTRKGSTNSGLPRSRTSPDETAAGKSGARGKGPSSYHETSTISRTIPDDCSRIYRDRGGTGPRTG